MRKNLKRISRIILLALSVLLILWVMRWCSSKDQKSSLEIENTPIRIEMIRSLAEIASVSYTDEVVVDSVELYKDLTDALSGTLEKIFSPKDYKYGIYPNAVKRRLTLIVKGELKVGFDLKKHPIQIIQNDSTIQLTFPAPEILEIVVSPQSNEIYQENGTWKDFEIQKLHRKAKMKLAENVAELKLYEIARKNVTYSFSKLLPSKKIELIFKN